MESIHVQGLAELQRTLDTLPAKLEANLIRAALRAGAKVIADEAKRRVPVQQGDLRASIRASVRIKPRLGRVEAIIKAGRGKPAGVTYMAGGKLMVRDASAFYAHMVERGTKRHWIKVSPNARPTRITRRGVRAYSLNTINKMAYRGSLVIGGNFVGESLIHPGARPKPFMAPALQAKARAALDAFADTLRRRIPIELAKRSSPR